MNDENGNQTEEVQPFPRCPFCDADPVKPMFRMWANAMIVFFCAECRKVLSVFPLPPNPMNQPRVIPTSTMPPPLIRP